MKDSIIAVRSIQFDSNNDLLLVQVGFGVTQNDGERACGSLEVRLVGLGQSLDQIKSRAVLQARLILEGVLFGQSEKTENSKDLPITDPLTGLLNRRYLEERFAEELERSKRYQYPLSFAMIDIDSFKSFNDTFGHQAGDEVLRATAHCIRGSLRNFDVAARYGGEEFILVLPETDTLSAVAVAERLRKQVEELFSRAHPPLPITVSIGVVGLNQHLHSKHQIIRAAEQALYEAKKDGKNRVEVYRGEPDVKTVELTIPISDDKEIIAARVAEQLARSVGFSAEAINMIKTALIEACLSLAANEASDGYIYQRYHVSNCRFSATLSDTADGLDTEDGTHMENDPDRIWRLDVLRSLMDQVTLRRQQNGWRIDLTKTRIES